MKRSVFFSAFLFAVMTLCACENTSGGKTAVQHDTLKSNSDVNSSVQDSVLQNGEYIKHYENGVIEMRGMMKDGKREGLWKSWYQNGSPWSETTFSKGVKNGKTTTWYENEKKRYDGFYTNDIESGKWSFWDEKGKLVKEMDYDVK